MRKITRPIKDPRDFFIKLQSITSIVFVLSHFIAIKLNIWKPPETLLAEIILYCGVPLILFSLYFTGIKRIFPQRIGDIIHSYVLISVISAFAICYDGSIGGNFVFLFFLLIAVSILFLDEFLPLFIAGMASLIIGIEFILTINFSPSYVHFF